MQTDFDIVLRSQRPVWLPSYWIQFLELGEICRGSFKIQKFGFWICFGRNFGREISHEIWIQKILDAILDDFLDAIFGRKFRRNFGRNLAIQKPIQKPIQKSFQLLSLLKFFWTHFWTQVSEDSIFFLDAVLDAFLDDVFLTPFFLDASSDQILDDGSDQILDASWTTAGIDDSYEVGNFHWHNVF